MPEKLTDWPASIVTGPEGVSIVPFGYFEGEVAESSRRPLSEVAFLGDPGHPIE